jgi:hypothetical protein
MAEKQEVTQPGPSDEDVKRQEQIARADDKARAEGEDVVVRTPRKGEGGVSFDYGTPSTESDSEKDSFDPENPGGQSFDYGKRK